MTAEPLGWLQLGGAASLIVINGMLSVWLGLGLERRLAIASVRTVVQLLLLGFVLVPVFAWSSPLPVLALCLVMMLLAAREAVRRTSRGYRGAGASAFVALLIGAGGSAVLGSAVIIGVEPWWTPRYLVPLVGMILGNALTGVNLGLDRVLTGLDEGRAQVETRLALGATWWEAARPTAAEAVRAGMIPIINAMSVVGLVTIPGMTTGQILGGAPPSQAVQYQILIMFLIAAATGLGTMISVLLAVRALFDPAHRLRLDRLLK